MEAILPNTHLKVKSCNGAVYQVPLKTARWSGLLNGYIELIGFPSLNEDPIVLENVNTCTLLAVLEWMEQHQYYAEKEGRRGFSKFVLCTGISDRGRLANWEEEFLKINASCLQEIHAAASKMRVDGLVAKVSQKMDHSSKISGKKH